MKPTTIPTIPTIGAALALLLSAAAPSHAEVISIDFAVYNISPDYSGSLTTSGGLVPLAGQTGTWNRLLLGTSGGGSSQIGLTGSRTITDLTDGSGGTTTIDFAFNTGGGTFNAFDASDLNEEDALGRDVAYLASSGTSASIGWEFTGLLPGTSYTIRIFGQTDRVGETSNDSPQNFASFTVAGGTPASATTSVSQNYVDFTATSDGSGKIAGTFDYPGTGFASMSGIQIVPEPSSALLGLVGMLGLLRRRRVS